MARKDKDNTPAAASYLGSLRSELDEASDLDPNFIKLESAFGLVRSAYVSKKISAVNAAKLFQKLFITSADNADWTLGSTTASWYRRENGGSWVHSSPPIGILVNEKKLPNWALKGIEEEIDSLKVDTEPDKKEFMEEILDIDIASNKELSKNVHIKLESHLSYDPSQSLSWLDEEWTLAGNESINPQKTDSAPEETVEEVSETISGRSSISPRDGNFNPEDFFLKDE